MTNCYICGKIIVDGGLRDWAGTRVCSKNCLDKLNDISMPSGEKIRTTIIEGPSQEQIAQQAAQKAAQEAQRSTEEAARKSAELAAQASKEAKEAEERTAKRAAWPDFENKYSHLFEYDIPDWFVELFHIDKERGRYIANDIEKIKGIITITEAEGNKADNFAKKYIWLNEGDNRWLTTADIFSKVEKKRKLYEEASGIKFDEPLSTINEFNPLKIISGYIEAKNWCIDSKGYYFYEIPNNIIQAGITAKWIVSSNTEFFKPFINEATNLGKSINEVNWSDYKRIGKNIYKKTLLQQLKKAQPCYVHRSLVENSTVAENEDSINVFHSKAKELGKSIDDVDWADYIYCNQGFYEKEIIYKLFRIRLSYHLEKQLELISQPEREEIYIENHFNGYHSEIFFKTDEKYVERCGGNSTWVWSMNIGGYHGRYFNWAIFSLKDWDKIKEKGPEKYFEEEFGQPIGSQPKVDTSKNTASSNQSSSQSSTDPLSDLKNAFSASASDFKKVFSATTDAYKNAFKGIGNIFGGKK